jgi:hypothetical protein
MKICVSFCNHCLHHILGLFLLFIAISKPSERVVISWGHDQDSRDSPERVWWLQFIRPPIFRRPAQAKLTGLPERVWLALGRSFHKYRASVSHHRDAQHRVWMTHHRNAKHRVSVIHQRHAQHRVSVTQTDAQHGVSVTRRSDAQHRVSVTHHRDAQHRV